MLVLVLVSTAAVGSVLDDVSIVLDIVSFALLVDSVLIDSDEKEYVDIDSVLDVSVLFSVLVSAIEVESGLDDSDDIS